MHPKPHKGAPRLGDSRGSVVHHNKTLGVFAFNIEGVKGNISTLLNLTRRDSIICLQETWLWTFESNVINNVVPSYDSFVRYSDINDNISNFQVPRGKGGIAIICSNIKRLEDGNERVQAIEVLTSESKLCIINAYFPTLNPPSSRDDYLEKLDAVHNIIHRYSETHKIVFCGDLNGFLLASRTNPHDSMLKDFVVEHGLYSDDGVCSTPTFFGHSGSSSQIDYILVNDTSLLCQVLVSDQLPSNMSSHVSVKATPNLGMNNDVMKQKKLSTKAVTKLL